MITSRFHYPFFFFNDTATTEIYPLSLPDALPISMAGPFIHLVNSARRPALAMVAAAAMALPLLATPAAARGPENIADVAEAVIDAVVNISTSQTVTAGWPSGPSRTGPENPPGPQGPEGPQGP